MAAIGTPMSMAMEQVLEQVRGERFRQDVKWGQQNHEDGTHHDPMNLAYAEHCRKLAERAAQEGRLTWGHILIEEAAEALAELIQVAAVAVAWIECGDRR